MTTITSVPTTYAGVEFRSTLEADWAATLDSLGIVWQYEPEAVRLPSGTLYRPDFYLPRIATWLEVKGPHMQRIFKARELSGAVFHFPDCTGAAACEGDECYCGGFGHDCGCHGEYQLVVIGLASERGLITWQLLDQLIDDPSYSSFNRCRSCSEWWWMSHAGLFGCRAHRRHCAGDDDLSVNSFGPDDDDRPPFVRAPAVTR